MGRDIKVDVWSDIACPWCYIGKRNLEAGMRDLAEGPHSGDVVVEYHSFQLAPETPVDFHGTELEFLVSHKGVGEARARELLGRVTGIARSVGLDYDFDAVRHTNTVKAHQLLHYAKARGAQLVAKERLMSAYFVEGRHVGHDEDLADLAAEVGLDRDDVLRSLRADEYLEAVRADERSARRHGITGVPFFVVGDRYGISGAQPSDAFARALARTAAVGDEAVAS